jgi:biopolymer transport protein ExbB
MRHFSTRPSIGIGTGTGTGHHSTHSLSTASSIALSIAMACTLAFAFSGVPTAFAQSGGAAAGADNTVTNPPKPKSLEELLEMVADGFETERAINRRRVAEFQRNQQEQDRLLADALADLARQEAVGQELEVRYNENELEIGTSQERMTNRLGELGELFGVVRQVAGDLSAQTLDSLTNSDGVAKNDLLDRLGRSAELPTTDDLEQLWVELQREITKQGEIKRYTAKIVTIEGSQEERDIIRAGPFTAISEGAYLNWEPDDQLLRELGRQPPSRHLDTVPAFANASGGYAMLAVDPSRGGLLVALIDAPSNTERVQQGGYVGYVIISLGFIALLVGGWRWVVITLTARNVTAQRKNERIDSGNPLGRVLEVAGQYVDSDVETLELKLDEIVLREASSLENYLWLVKTVSVVSPLLGLLGTVTGMIQTFQAITLFGAGDPKMMAGGISQALVTTMLGLIVAIPLVLLSDTLANSTRKIIDILDEKSAGLIALRSERSNVGD